MSIFPFTQDVPELEERAAQELPVFRELAYDYENNCLKRKGGKTYLVEKDEAVRVWIYKALLTRRFVWPAYTHAYGSELEAAIGYSNNRDILDSEVKRYITETLMVNPYIQELSGFRFEHRGSEMTVAFDVTTVYGRFTHETEVYNE